MGPYVVPKGVLSRELAGEMVILDTVSGSYFRLNPSGSAVWALAREGADVEEIAAVLCRDHGAGEGTARQDVDHLLAVLADRGLLLRSE